MVCHLGPGERKKARLGWFISGPNGIEEASREDSKALLMPFIEAGGERKVLGSRSGEPHAEISPEGKHAIRLGSSPCVDCHSSEGLKEFQKVGYDRDDLLKPDKFDYIISFTEGNVFYYPRF